MKMMKVPRKFYVILCNWKSRDISDTGRMWLELWLTIFILFCHPSPSILTSVSVVVFGLFSLMVRKEPPRLTGVKYFLARV